MRKKIDELETQAMILREQLAKLEDRPRPAPFYIEDWDEEYWDD